MDNGGRRGGKFLGGLLLVLLLAGGLAWVERMTLLAWFRVRLLAAATDDNREARALQVARLGEAACADLFACLHREEPDVCRNARAGLAALVELDGGSGGQRPVDLAGKLAREFPQLSAAGQQQVLGLAGEWFRDNPAEPAPGLMLNGARLLAAAAANTDAGVQASALDLCGLLVAHPHGGEALSAGRELVRAYLHAESPAIRLRAVLASQQRGMDLYEPVAGLLGDPAVEVRRAALVVVGPATEVVLDETLLPCLRDPDADMRKLAELVLTNERRLNHNHLRLARLLMDPSPTVRLGILQELTGDRPPTHDIDTGVWLRRLSHDPAPSVRLAAVRVMSELRRADLTDRLEQIAQNDASPTVCAAASYWLRSARAARAEPAQP
jgi:hypothetical protein